MNYKEPEIFQKHKIKIRNLLPEIGIEKAREEIIAGLISEKKYISSKFFYDKTGSELFEQITALPEYYPTRTEINILRDIAPELINGNSSLDIIELGSGNCSKITILFEAVNGHHKNMSYIPVDVSKSAIENSSNELCEKFPDLIINGYVADFMLQLNQIPRSHKQRIICFFGSTIGNFSLNDAKKIICNFSKGLIQGDSLLIGFDLVKAEPFLRAAYNDSKGITHKFNKNILNVVNHILESDFKLENFDSLSFYNKEKCRNEMHLVASKSCTIQSPFMNKILHMKKGDSIHTENSYKYTVPTIEELLKNTGLQIKNIYTDKKEWFALVQIERE